MMWSGGHYEVVWTQLERNCDPESRDLGPAPPASAISDLFVPSVNKPRTAHKTRQPPLLLAGVTVSGEVPTGRHMEEHMLRDVCAVSGRLSAFPPCSRYHPDIWTPPREKMRWRSASQHSGQTVTQMLSWSKASCWWEVREWRWALVITSVFGRRNQNKAVGQLCG